MALALALLVAAAVALGVLWRDPLQVLLGFTLALGCLMSAWLCERHLAAGRSQGVSAALFGAVANGVGAGLKLRLIMLPYGSSFDSFSLWTAEWTFFGLAGVTGIALGVRGLVRARRLWKLLALVGLLLSLTPMIVSHEVLAGVVDARGLHWD